MSNSLEKKQPAPAIEVTELEDSMLDIAAGGLFSAPSLNIDCDTTNQGCNTVAGCGGKG